MPNSTHRVEVVPVRLEPHPNADSLSIVTIFDAYTCVVKTADWQGVAMGAYIPPDNVVPDTSEYAFLGGKRRIKARQIRGIMSEGLLVRAPEGSQLGDDVAEILGVTHYVPKAASTPGVSSVKAVSAATPPGCEHVPEYDLEAFKKYGRLAFDVVVTEKIHGQNGRFVYSGGEFHVGSRARWVKRSESGRENNWYKVLDKYEGLRMFLQTHPGWIVFGEVYGWVQDLKYGHGPGEVSFAAFDVMTGPNRWVDAHKLHDVLLEFGVPAVPLVHRGAFDFDAVLAMADGPSLVPGADHLREGVVVKPALERTDRRFGRCALKIVSPKYLERAK